MLGSCVTDEALTQEVPVAMLELDQMRWEVRSNGNCSASDRGVLSVGRGRWVVDTRGSCLQLCVRCPRCRFVSYRENTGMCIWFHQCDLSKLGHILGGFRTYAAHLLDPAELMNPMAPALLGDDPSSARGAPSSGGPMPTAPFLTYGVEHPRPLLQDASAERLARGDDKCKCFFSDHCDLASAEKLVASVPAAVEATSVWAPYLRAVHGPDVLPYSLLFPFRGSTSRYLHLNASLHLPLASCMLKSQDDIPRMWPAQWPYNRQFMQRRKEVSAEDPPACSDACRDWTQLDDTREPSQQPERIIPLFDESTKHPRLIALRWWFVEDRVSVPDGSWLEISRKSLERDAKPGVGKWFTVSPGTGIWLNVGRSARIRRKDFQGSALFSEWLSLLGIREVDTVRADRAVRRLVHTFHSAFLGKPWWYTDIFTIMAYELEYDSVQISTSVSGTVCEPELVLISRSSMLRPDCNTSGLTLREGLVRCSRPEVKACPDGTDLRTQRATKECHCDDTSLLLRCT